MKKLNLLSKFFLSFLLVLGAQGEGQAALPDSDFELVFVLETDGAIVKLGKSLARLGEIAVENQRAISCAKLSMDGEKIIVAGVAGERPLRIVSIEDMNEDNVRFPEYPAPQIEGFYWPENILNPLPNIIYYCDTSFGDFPLGRTLRIDMGQQSVSPSESFSLLSDDRMRLSPDGKSLLIISKKNLDLIDCASGKLVRQFPLADKEYGVLYGVDADWSRGVISLWHGAPDIPEEGRQCELDLKSGRTNFEIRDAIWPSIPIPTMEVLSRTFRSAFLDGLHQPKSGRTILTRIEAEALSRIEQSWTSNLAKQDVYQCYLSPTGQFLFIILAKESPERFYSEIVVLNTRTGELMSAYQSQSAVRTLLFKSKSE